MHIQHKQPLLILTPLSTAGIEPSHYPAIKQYNLQNKHRINYIQTTLKQQQDLHLSHK